MKPLRDGWIAVSDVGGLSQMELKAYTSFGQSLLLARRRVGLRAALGALAAAARSSRARRSSASRTWSLFWLLQPGLLVDNLPGAGVVFYLWVGMFGVFVVAQFWTFAADLYAGERGERLLPLIAIGATAGAALRLVPDRARSSDAELVDSGTLLLLAIVPLAGVDRADALRRRARPAGGTPRAERSGRATPAAERPAGRAGSARP